MTCSWLYKNMYYLLHWVPVVSRHRLTADNHIGSRTHTGLVGEFKTCLQLRPHPCLQIHSILIKLQSGEGRDLSAEDEYTVKFLDVQMNTIVTSFEVIGRKFRDSYLRPRWLISHYQPLVTDPFIGGDTEARSQPTSFTFQACLPWAVHILVYIPRE